MSTTAIEILQAQFPKKLRFTPIEIASIINWHPQTIRNKISKNTFGIHTYIECGKRYADIRDVAEYLDKMRNKRKVGRPTKASNIDSKK